MRRNRGTERIDSCIGRRLSEKRTLAVKPFQYNERRITDSGKVHLRDGDRSAGIGQYRIEGKCQLRADQTAVFTKAIHKRMGITVGVIVIRIAVQLRFSFLCIRTAISIRLVYRAAIGYRMDILADSLIPDLRTVRDTAVQEPCHPAGTEVLLCNPHFISIRIYFIHIQPIAMLPIDCITICKRMSGCFIPLIHNNTGIPASGNLSHG